MPSRRKVSNLLALAVLSYLVRGPMHPYEMSRTLRQNGDDRSIKFNHGSLYMVVGQLSKAGFITEYETNRDGQRPERTLYTLTDAGEAELRNWLRELVEQPAHEFPQFVVALSLIAVLPPDEVLELLATRARHLDEQQQETRALIDSTVAAGVHPLFLIEEEYRLTMLSAERTFVDKFIDQITAPDTGWGPQWAQFHQSPAHTEETP